VVAAAIFDPGGRRLLIQRRHARQQQGGLWEFPGGKLEPGESRQAALARELDEELGIRPLRARPLIRIHHDYPERRVLLDVWRVDEFVGEPRGCEGQPIRWVAREHLGDYRYPAANLPVVAAAQLPDRLLVTPAPDAGDAFLGRLERALATGVELVQLRAPALSADDYAALAREALALVEAAGAALLLNADADMLQRVPAHGLHLSGRRLRACRQRPVAGGALLSCACHDAADLARAAELGADFALLGALRETASHPGREPLGWARFAELVEAARLPVYALGGMAVADLPKAWAQGAQGIAAIRALWPDE